LSRNYLKQHPVGLSWENPIQWAGQDVLTAMNARDRHELVILTSGFKGFVKSDTNHATYEPKPIHADQVILSALGGWLKSRGNWEPPAEWIPYQVRSIDSDSKFQSTAFLQSNLVEGILQMRVNFN
jgi:hypothetical protein